MRLPLSGAPWLSNLPPSWQVKPIAALFTERNLRNDGVGQKQLLSLSYGRVVRKDINANDGLRPESYDTYQQLEPNNIVLRLIDLQNDKRSIRVGQATERGIITSAYVALDTDNWACSRYAFYLLLVLDQLKVFYGLGSGMRQSITFSDLGRVPVGVPSDQEQLAIANYLDTEIKRIDGLIEEKADLLKLIQKLSIALIDDAIEGKTHIDGVATLGSWEKARLRFKARVNPRASVALNDDAYVSFLPMEAIGEDGSLQLDETRKVADVAQGYTFFEEGDVTIAKITPCFENRKGAVMSRLVGGLGFGTTELIVLRPEADVDAKFLYYLTQSSRFRLNGEASMTGSGGQKRVSDLYVKDFETKWPPLESQKVISKYIETQLLKNADLIRHVESELDLLKELRASTITDAVLGHIDVRQAAKH